MARSSSPSVAASDNSSREASHHSLAHSLLSSVRPAQWTKNLLVFAGLLFGRRLMDASAFAHAVAAFLIFCALSSAVYLINDVADRDTDREHPLKAQRPIASGALSGPAGIICATVLI